MNEVNNDGFNDFSNSPNSIYSVLGFFHHLPFKKENDKITYNYAKESSKTNLSGTGGVAEERGGPKININHSDELRKNFNTNEVKKNSPSFW